MAVFLDGHEIDSLVLNASNGNSVTKQLTTKIVFPVSETGSAVFQAQGQYATDTHFDFGDAVLNGQSMFMNTVVTGGTKKIKVTAKRIQGNSSTVGPLQLAYQGTFDTLELDTEEPVIYPSRCASRNVKYITGTPMKLVSASGGYGYDTFSIVEIRFVENTATGDCNLGGTNLSNDSLISIANALTNANGETLTLTFTAAVKAKLANIVGRAANVTADGVTYQRFVAAAGGSLTLQDFITTTKGWTLA